MAGEPRQSIVSQTPPNLVGQPSVEFDKNGFEAAIHNKGYNIVIEKALRCPCESDETSNLSSCTNCQGHGYFYINPISTWAIITGINSETKYKEWSTEKLGSVQVTVRDDGAENLSFYDKITFIKKYAEHSERLSVKNLNGQDFVFPIYKVSEIVDVFIFEDSDSPLIKLDPSEYNIKIDNSYVIELNIGAAPTNFNGSISVRYKHEIQYNVIDIPNEVRMSKIINDDGAEEIIDLPVNAIARRAHLLINDKPNYDGTGLQDNSYQ